MTNNNNFTFLNETDAEKADKNTIKEIKEGKTTKYKGFDFLKIFKNYVHICHLHKDKLTMLSYYHDEDDAKSFVDRFLKLSKWDDKLNIFLRKKDDKPWSHFDTIGDQK